MNDITALTPESSRESGNILIIVAARMARREFFTSLHILLESGKRVVSTRALRDAVDRAKEHMVSQIPKIVDGYDRLNKKLKEAESRNAELVEALEKAQRVEDVNVAERQAFLGLINDRDARIAALESRTATAAASDVLAERQRQISAEGWSAEHDDEHAPGQLSAAGGCYALNAFEDGKVREGYEPDWWPWEQHWYKPGTPRRDLIKAAALIIAEIEHLDRSNDDE